MKRLALLCLIGFPASLHADTNVARDKTIVLGHPEVNGMLRDGNLRAFTGMNPQGVYWVALERLEGNGPAWQYWITDAMWGRSAIALRNVRKIRLDSFHHGVLAFSGSYENRDWVKCSIDTRQKQWTTSCSGNYTGGGGAPPPAPPPPQPQPQQPNWAAQPHIIKACGETFDGPQNETACMDVMRGFRYDPAPVIGQCDTTMDGDINELACLRTASSARFDPSAGLARCDNSMDGDVNEQRCLETIVRARYAIGPAIDACDTAMDGDTNELACIVVAVAAPSDPSRTIAACDESMSGDVAELDCVKRAFGVK